MDGRGQNLVLFQKSWDTPHHLLGDREVPETITEFLLVFSFSVICDLSGRAVGF